MKTRLMFLIIEATIEYGTLDIVKLPVKFTHAYMRIGNYSADIKNGR
jgi:hypothetical protein